MVPRPNLVGEQFGSYRLLRLLGAGGFAEVYLGEHVDLGTQAAIKVLHTKLSPTDIDAFRTEARTIARLHHPHIIGVLDFNTAGSTPFLVLDYAAGGTMRQRYPKGTILPLTTVVAYIQQVADALQYAHDEKLIHRDIKPENILLDQYDNILLSDFGIALAEQSSSNQSTQNVTGTVTYMSPEQIQGHPRPASDQYSLAIVIYEWLSGTRPFQGSLTEVCTQHMFAPPPPLREKAPTIPPDVEYVIMTALQKDPKQRFGNIRAFATALQQASQVRQAQAIIPPRPQAHNPIPARPPIDTRPQGRLKWSFDTSNSVYSSPTVVNGVLYFGSSDHNLYALDASSGRLKWSFPTRDFVVSSPTVVNGVLYFGSGDHNLYALDASSGRLKWSFPTHDFVASSPTVVNGVLYFGSHDRKFYALNASSGHKTWSFRSGNTIFSLPAVVNGIVYFGSYDRKIYALNTAYGHKMWSFATGSSVHSSPTVVNGVVYVGSHDGNLYALDATSGHKMWSFLTSDKVTSSPSVVNGLVYFGSEDGNLYALNATSGRKMWSFFTSDKVTSSPTVVNGVVYVGSHDHNLYALDASSGRQKWSFQTRNRIQSSPTVVNSVVYVGSDDGKLYAIFA